MGCFTHKGQFKTGDAAMTFDLDDGRRLVYRDDVQMGKVYVVAPGAYAGVPNLEGPEAKDHLCRYAVRSGSIVQADLRVLEG